MKTHTMLALGCLSLLAPSLFGQTDTPAISEEARKHFVMGTALAKDAKTAADFSQVVSEFKQAVDLAPQLPEARYNLAKAREAADDFSGAIADLKRYQQFKLSDSEARTVQDKIYALEAKTKKQAGEQKVTAAEQRKSRDYQSKMGFLAGGWNARKIIHYDRVGMQSGPFDQSSFHADITIKNDEIAIDVVDTGPRPSGAIPLHEIFNGKTHGGGLDSITWKVTSGLANARGTTAEVAISPGHKRIVIYTPLSYNGRVDPHGQEWLLSR